MAIAAPITPSRKELPPPIFIHDKSKWMEVSTACKERRIHYSNARTVQAGIKVSVNAPSDFRELHRLLVARKVPFHTYSLAEEKQHRAVVRNVPREIPADEILRDLQSQKVPATQVHRMHRRGGAAYDMVLVVSDQVNGYHPIFKVSTICGLSGIRVENPNKSGIVSQCHRCQLYGHAQKTCYGKPRCVKCLGDHGTSDCPRPKDRALCLEPPSCVLCGEKGHPANYRGCPKAPKSSSPKLAKRAVARQQRERPSPVGIPRRNPWTGNHQAHFPALRKPAPQVPQATSTQVAPPQKAIPALMDLAIPPFAPPATTRAFGAQGSRPVQQAQPPIPQHHIPKVASPSKAGPDAITSRGLIIFKAFYSTRALSFDRALKECGGNHAPIFAQFSDVVHYIEMYESLNG